MTDHILWKSEPFSKGQAWLDLLLHANFTDNDILIKGQVVKLKRGQQARSEVTLSKSWKWSRNKVRRFLELLKKEGMIESKTTHLTSIISICNYESFQSLDTAGGTANDTSVDTAGEHLTKHSKECKEGKKVKQWGKSRFASELISLGAEKQFVDDWMKSRKTFTETAFNGTIKQIEKSGLTVNDAVRLSAENGWVGFKAEYVKSENIPFDQITDLYNQKCLGLKKCFDLTNGRKSGIIQIWNSDQRNQNGKFWANYLTKVNSIADPTNEWENSADFAFNYKTFVKIMEL